MKKSIAAAFCKCFPWLGRSRSLKTYAQCLTDFQRATHRLFRAAEKKQHHPVPSWQTNEFSTGFRFPETFCSANNSIELLH